MPKLEVLSPHDLGRLHACRLGNFLRFSANGRSLMAFKADPAQFSPVIPNTVQALPASISWNLIPLFSYCSAAQTRTPHAPQLSITT